MNRVAQSEFDLLSVARALVGGVSARAVEPLLATPHATAPALGPTAMGLLEQTLSRGAVLELGRRGGWRPAAHLRSPGEVVAGRLWERHRTPVALGFSSATIELLQWLVASPLALPSACAPLEATELTLGDQLVHYLACDLVVRCELPAASLGRSPAFLQAPLCWLGFPDLLGNEAAFAERGPPPGAWTLLVTDGVVILEALQADLARRWLAVERGKQRVHRPESMISIGESQLALLTGLAELLEERGRRDLMGFAVEAAGKLLRFRPDPGFWTTGIAPAGSLAERQRAFRAAGALLEAVVRLGRWVEQAQGVRFFDEDYEASQLLLAQWGALGTDGLAHARTLGQKLSKLDASLAGDTQPDEEVSE